MADIANNKYLDYIGLEYFKNNYIQNIYSFSLEQNNITENDVSKQLIITGNITITSSNSNKTTYTLAEAKRGDILYANTKKTAYIVTDFSTSGNDDTRTEVRLTPIAGGGLKSATYDSDANKFKFELTDGETIEVDFSDIATLESNLTTLESEVVKSEGGNGFGSGEIVAGTGNNRNITGTGITVDDLVTIANGQTQTYVIDVNGKQEGSGQASVVNSQFNATTDRITINKTSNSGPSYLLLVDSTMEKPNTVPLTDLQIGDTVLLTNTDYPDRWVSEISSNTITFSILETRKINLDDYLKTPTDIGNPTFQQGNILTYEDNTTHSFIKWTNNFDNWMSSSTYCIPTITVIQAGLSRDYYTKTDINNTFATIASLNDYVKTSDANNNYLCKNVDNDNVKLEARDDSNAYNFKSILKETGGYSFIDVKYTGWTLGFTNTNYKYTLSGGASGSLLIQRYDDGTTLSSTEEILDTSMAIEFTEIDAMFGVTSE